MATTSKRSPRPQLRRWIHRFEDAWNAYFEAHNAWKNAFDDERGPEPRAPLYRDVVIKPLADFLNKHCFGGKAKVEVYGPQGIGGRMTMDFRYRGRLYYLGVEPVIGSDTPLMLRIRRFDLKSSGEYGPGSIGAINCMNFPTTDVAEAYPASWWRKRMVITNPD